MTSEELGVMLNLRATLSEYEHFMCELSAMIERGVDVPPCGVAKFPMREKLYAQVRDLVLGANAMTPLDILDTYPKFVPGDPHFGAGDHVYWANNPKMKGVIYAFNEEGDKAMVRRDSDNSTCVFDLKELIHCDDGK